MRSMFRCSLARSTPGTYICSVSSPPYSVLIALTMQVHLLTIHVVCIVFLQAGIIQTDDSNNV
jgi:hypothetical protein